MTAIANVEGKDLPRLLVHREPNPLLIGFLLHETPHLVGFHLQTPDEYLPGSRDGQHMEMIRQRRKAGRSIYRSL